MNRNDFFREGGRWAILAGIGLLSFLLIYDHRVSSNKNCSVLPQCKGCGKLSQCTLPQADKVRNNGK